ncbi:MAG: DUF3298 domain-containing protein [Candidatus Galacturonibacter soehngenii]|nr:DUF3298 domain-containing protein [Candidatus Galacturonibacter soehngenii]
MKKQIVTLGILVSLSLVACQNRQLIETNQLDTKEDLVTQPIIQEEIVQKVITENNEYINDKKSLENNSNISVVFEDRSREERDKKGNLLLTVTSNIPVVTIPGNEEASQKINAYYKESEKKQEEKIKEYIDYATDHFSLLNTDQVENWNGYGLGDIYGSKRVDQAAISIVDDTYEYAGGAHPNTTRTAQNFDTQSGNLLTLKDVLTDEEKGIAFVNEFLLKKMKESEDELGFFEDYENYVKDILTDQTWYFSDEGFVVISNVYIVSPYAAGIQEYVIPYSQFPYLVEKYQKK